MVTQKKKFNCFTTCLQLIVLTINSYVLYPITLSIGEFLLFIKLLSFHVHEKRFYFQVGPEKKAILNNKNGNSTDIGIQIVQRNVVNILITQGLTPNEIR